MGKYTDAKCRLCRRAGDKLFLKGDRCQTAKCAIVKRNYPPGFHGSKMRRRLSEYATQLSEKQKARRQFNLMEKQFKLTFDKASNKTGNVGENFLKLLEMRFDNTIYRLGFANSRAQARQLINHGHFTINDKPVNIPSYLVRTGEVIKIKANKKTAKAFANLSDELKRKEIPGWLNMDPKELKAKVLGSPDINSIKPNFNIQMIVEYYSR